MFKSEHQTWYLTKQRWPVTHAVDVVLDQKKSSVRNLGDLVLLLPVFGNPMQGYGEWPATIRQFTTRNSSKPEHYQRLKTLFHSKTTRKTNCHHTGSGAKSNDCRIRARPNNVRVWRCCRAGNTTLLSCFCFWGTLRTNLSGQTMRYIQ